MEYATPYDGTEVAIGTPVEIPEDDARKKPVPVQDQVVTDDRGACSNHATKKIKITFLLDSGYLVGLRYGSPQDTLQSSSRVILAHFFQSKGS